MESTVTANQPSKPHGLTTKKKIYEEPAITILNLAENIMFGGGFGSDGSGACTSGS